LDFLLIQAIGKRQGKEERGDEGKRRGRNYGGKMKWIGNEQSPLVNPK
jgi:hypothetical protein